MILALRILALKILGLRIQALRILAIKILAIRILALRILALWILALWILALRILALRILALRILALWILALWILALRILALSTWKISILKHSNNIQSGLCTTLHKMNVMLRVVLLNVVKPSAVAPVCHATITLRDGFDNNNTGKSHSKIWEQFGKHSVLTVFSEIAEKTFLTELGTFLGWNLFKGSLERIHIWCRLIERNILMEM
jgi:hypothetical protein